MFNIVWSYTCKYDNNTCKYYSVCMYIGDGRHTYMCSVQCVSTFMWKIGSSGYHIHINMIAHEISMLWMWDIKCECTMKKKQQQKNIIINSNSLSTTMFHKCSLYLQGK